MSTKQLGAYESTVYRDFSKLEYTMAIEHKVCSAIHAACRAEFVCPLPLFPCACSINPYKRSLLVPIHSSPVFDRAYALIPPRPGRPKKEEHIYFWDLSCSLFGPGRRTFFQVARNVRRFFSHFSEARGAKYIIKSFGRVVSERAVDL